MRASDARALRVLGYRASGVAADNMLTLDCEPEVHDEKRPAWTRMNPTDRPDIRKELTTRARKAIEMLKKSGDATFEYKIP
jgi:hypothetical protein